MQWLRTRIIGPTASTVDAAVLESFEANNHRRKDGGISHRELMPDLAGAE
jgi:hypothetical protein